jgi:hypothetical protein
MGSRRALETFIVHLKPLPPAVFTKPKFFGNCTCATSKSGGVLCLVENSADALREAHAVGGWLAFAEEVDCVGRLRDGGSALGFHMCSPTGGSMG